MVLDIQMDISSFYPVFLNQQHFRKNILTQIEKCSSSKVVNVLSAYFKLVEEYTQKPEKYPQSMFLREYVIMFDM